MTKTRGSCCATSVARPGDGAGAGAATGAAGEEDGGGGTDAGEGTGRDEVQGGGKGGWEWERAEEACWAMLYREGVGAGRGWGEEGAEGDQDRGAAAGCAGSLFPQQSEERGGGEREPGMERGLVGLLQALKDAALGPPPFPRPAAAGHPAPPAPDVETPPAPGGPLLAPSHPAARPDWSEWGEAEAERECRAAGRYCAGALLLWLRWAPGGVCIWAERRRRVARCRAC